MAEKKQFTLRKTDKILAIIAQAQREGLTVAEFIFKIFTQYMGVVK